MWMPIEQGLEENRVVLFYSKVDIGSDIISVYTVGYMDDGELITLEDKILGVGNIETTHWMPLPPPPE